MDITSTLIYKTGKNIQQAKENIGKWTELKPEERKYFKSEMVPLVDDQPKPDKNQPFVQKVEKQLKQVKERVLLVASQTSTTNIFNYDNEQISELKNLPNQIESIAIKEQFEFGESDDDDDIENNGKLHVPFSPDFFSRHFVVSPKSQRSQIGNELNSSETRRKYLEMDSQKLSLLNHSKLLQFELLMLIGINLVAYMELNSEDQLTFSFMREPESTDICYDKGIEFCYSEKMSSWLILYATLSLCYCIRRLVIYLNWKYKCIDPEKTEAALWAFSFIFLQTIDVAMMIAANFFFWTYFKISSHTWRILFELSIIIYGYLVIVSYLSVLIGSLLFVIGGVHYQYLVINPNQMFEKEQENLQKEIKRGSLLHKFDKSHTIKLQEIITPRVQKESQDSQGQSTDSPAEIDFRMKNGELKIGSESIEIYSEVSKNEKRALIQDSCDCYVCMVTFTKESIKQSLDNSIVKSNIQSVIRLSEEQESQYLNSSYASSVSEDDMWQYYHKQCFHAEISQTDILKYAQIIRDERQSNLKSLMSPGEFTRFLQR